MKKRSPVRITDHALSSLLYGRENYDLCDFGVVNYDYLASLMQNGLIRSGVSAVADAMTAEWIGLARPGDGKDDDQDEALRALKEDMDRLDVQGVFSKAAQYIGYFGGCLVYIDVGETDPETLKTPLFEARQTIEGKVRRLVVIEPGTVTPGRYNTTNPLSEDFYNPTSWLLNGSVEVHKSRFLYFSSGELPYRIRQKFNFFGIPIAMIADRYVSDYARSKQAGNRLLGKLSRTVFKTPISDPLANGKSSDLAARIQYAADFWENDGILAIDAENEDVVEIAGNLTGATDIVRQNLEMIAAIFGVPVMKLLGISPAGMNATGEADLKNFHESVGHLQEKQLNGPLTRLLKILQLHLFGEVDRSITFEWNPLDEVGEEQRAAMDAQRMDTISRAVESGLASVEEGRAALVSLGVPGFDDLDISDVPEPPLDEVWTGEESIDPETMETGEAAPQDLALNGAHVASMVDVVSKVALGQLPRESGLNIILAAFPVSREAAEAILGDAGRGFIPAAPSEESSAQEDA